MVDGIQEKDLESLVADIVRFPDRYISKEDALVVIEAAYRTPKQDLRFGIQSFIKEILEEFGLSFCGVYLNSALNVYVEYDSSKRISYGVSREYDRGVSASRHHVFSQEEGFDRFVFPVDYRGKRFGFTVFEKPRVCVSSDDKTGHGPVFSSSFSESELAAIVSSVKLFSAHVNYAMKVNHLQVELQELKDELDRVKKDAALDEVTGIYTRKQFDRKFMGVVKDARSGGRRLCAIIGDIDHFKGYNDAFGHLAGDSILHQVAGLIKGNVRKEDIFGRYGGEEYVIVLPDATRHTAYDVARRVNHAVAGNYFEVDAPDVDASKRYSNGLDCHSVTMSLGVACSDDLAAGPVGESDDDFALRLLASADKNLYVAKALRNSVYGGPVSDIVPASIRNGLPDVSLIYSSLAERVAGCESDDKRLAVLLYNAVHFKEFIDEMGNDAAWPLLKSCISVLRTELACADNLASVCDGDRVVAIFSSGLSRDDLGSYVSNVGMSSLAKVRDSQSLTMTEASIDFALGVVIYDPQKVAASDREMLRKNPALLLSSVQNVTALADRSVDRFVLQYYTGTASV
jgi:diguanylate cyclase (GGDEF)-like protein